MKIGSWTGRFVGSLLEGVMSLEEAFVIFAAITFASIIWFGISSCIRPKNFPPGPSWLPVVGNTPFLKNLSRKLKGQHNAFSYLGHVHKSDIIGLKLGAQLFVVVRSESLIKQVFSKDEFQARPDSFFIRLRSMGTRKGITMTDGPLWYEQRTFALRHLHDLGFGKSVMETLILEELEDVLALLGKGGEIEWKKLLAPSVLNVLWALAAGSRFEQSDPRLSCLLALMEKRSGAFDMAGGVLSQMPWLRLIAPEYSGFNLIQDLNKQLSQMLLDTIAQHKKTLKEGVERDFIDVFLHQMLLTNGKPTTFTEDQLIMVCLDFFIAGSQTTSNTLDFALINMILHPEIQQKVQNEIDEVLSHKKVPSLTDRSRMQYTEAVLLESQRFQHVVPVSGPRRVLADTKLDNYDIPEGATVLLNVCEVHHDPALWGDPEVFRPERFIDSNGKFCPEELYMFGYGKRRCLGEALARNFLFLFFVGIVRHFTISAAPGKAAPTLEPNPGITLSPKPYTALLGLRKTI